MQVSQRITRKSASNLALAFILLPRSRRRCMAALYAFCREVDDIADEDGAPREQRRAQLAAWREDIRGVCQGQPGRFPVNEELRQVMRVHPLPFAHFDELIRGVEMDLDCARYADYAALEQYCYRVASVVGLLSIEIFGYSDPTSRDYAIHLGKALQLTNILRDVRADALRDRIYLPATELARWGVGEEEILAHRYSPRFRSLAASVADRARHFYTLARRTLPEVDRPAMVAAELMGTVYWRLLRRIEARQFDVLSAAPIRLSRPAKLWLILRAWLRQRLGPSGSDYGES